MKLVSCCRCAWVFSQNIVTRVAVIKHCLTNPWRATPWVAWHRVLDLDGWAPRPRNYNVSSVLCTPRNEIWVMLYRVKAWLAFFSVIYINITLCMLNTSQSNYLNIETCLLCSYKIFLCFRLVLWLRNSLFTCLE